VYLYETHILLYVTVKSSKTVHHNGFLILLTFYTFQLLHGIFDEEWNARVSMQAVGVLEFRITEHIVLKANAVSQTDLIVSVGGMAISSYVVLY